MKNYKRNLEFAKRLRNLRKRNRLEMYRLADLCGISRDMIRKYESCEAVPSADILAKIADYFEVKMDYLWGVSDEP